MGEMRLDVITIGKYHRTRARKSAPSHLIGLTPARILIYTSQAGNPYRSRDRLKFVNIMIRKTYALCPI